MLEIFNPIGILAASVAGYVIGMAWYSPILFMKPWLAGLGKTEEELKRPQEHKTKQYTWGIMTYTFLVTVAMAIALSTILTLTAPSSLTEALGVTMLLCFGFIVTTKFTDMLYTIDAPHWGIRAQKLFFVNTGYYVITFLAMGSILYCLG